MRVLWVVTLLTAAALAGCVETVDTGTEPETSENDEPADDVGSAQEAPVEEVVELVGAFVATFENTSVAAGADINLTLDYDGDDADAANLSWSLTFTPQVDATASDNSTGDGNATDDGNQTSADNATQPEPTILEGVGLPANVTLNLTSAGNYTVTGNATDGSSSVDLVETVIEVVALELAPADPCEGATPPEPITINAFFAAVAVDGTGLYQGHQFPIESECVSVIRAEITSSELYLDPMLRLKDNNGDTVDAEDNEFLYHDTLEYAPGYYVEPGTWQIDARGYIGAPGNYEIVLTFE